MKQFIFLMFLMAFFACQKPQPAIQRQPTGTVADADNKVQIFDFEHFKPFLNAPNDSTYVINFWATWCSPCVAELPAFEQLHQQYKDKNVKVILVSLDFMNKLEAKLLPFLKERKLQPEVLVLDQQGANEWLGNIDANWSGAIPATIIYHKKYRRFYEQSFTYEELDKALKEALDKY